MATDVSAVAANIDGLGEAIVDSLPTDRDRFAAAALTGLLNFAGVGHDPFHRDEREPETDYRRQLREQRAARAAENVRRLAAMAYELADAMVAARKAVPHAA